MVPTPATIKKSYSLNQSQSHLTHLASNQLFSYHYYATSEHQSFTVDGIKDP